MYIKKLTIEKNCPYCKKNFIQKRSNQKYCSRRCGKIIYTVRKKNNYKLCKKDKCDLCGFIPVHPCQLDVDHKDGNHKNNASCNLQTLCANCHRLKTMLCGEYNLRIMGRL